MNQMVFLALVLSLGLSGCAKKKTADKNMTQRQNIANQKKAELEAKAKEKELEEAKAKAEADAAALAAKEAEEKAKKEADDKAKKKDKADEVVIVPPAGGAQEPVSEIPKSDAKKADSAKPETSGTSTAAKKIDLAKASGAKSQAGAAGSGLPAEVDQKVKKAGSESLQKLTEKAQAAEKSDMKDIKPGTPEADWAQVINYVSEKGKYDDVAGGLESYLSLDDFSSKNLNEPYNRKMLSLVGGRDAKGNFGFSRVHAVDKDWSIDKNGNKVGILYQFLLGRDGSLAKVYLVKLVKESTSTERVIEHKSLDISEADGKARWELNRQYWIKKVVRNK